MSRRAGRHRPTLDEQLDEAYARIPATGCLGYCQDSCGSVAMAPIEQRRIAQRHGMVLPLADAPSLRTEQTPWESPGRDAARR